MSDWRTTAVSLEQRYWKYLLVLLVFIALVALSIIFFPSQGRGVWFRDIGKGYSVSGGGLYEVVVARDDCRGAVIPPNITHIYHDDRYVYATVAPLGSTVAEYWILDKDGDVSFGPLTFKVFIAKLKAEGIEREPAWKKAREYRKNWEKDRIFKYKER